LSAQKNEIEIRVVPDEVPAQAINWFDELPEIKSKIKWYFEKTSGAESYEAKFRYSKKWHSIEFDRDGNLEDAEIEISRDQISQEAWQSVVKSLEQHFTKFRVQRIQLQWTGGSSAVQQALQSGIASENVIVHFEIEYRGRNESKNALWEGLFDAKGEMVSQREIIVKPAENLSY
jgi:hypothetical protein